MKNNKRMILLIAVSLVCLVAYYTPVIIGYFAVAKDFTQQDAIEDYLYMWGQLEDNYPLFTQAENVYGIEAQEIKLEYQKILENKEDISFIEFYNMIQSCLAKFNYLGHLNVFSPDFYDFILYEMKSLKLNHKEIYSGFFNKLDDAINTPKSRHAYNYIEHFSKGKNGFSTKNKENITLYSFDDSAKVKINSFSSKYGERDAKRLQEFFNENKSKHIIIDITENGGGTDLYWQNLIVSPSISEDISTLTYSIIKDGSDTREFVYENGSLPDNWSSDFSELEKLSNIDKIDLDAVDYYAEVHHMIPATGIHTFEKDIYVLIGERTGSSAAGFAQFCKSSGYATLIGKTTQGDGDAGISPIYKAMPNSGIIFTYRMAIGLNEDGSNNAIFGTTPDYDSNDPFLTALELIRANRQ